jgi:hypothetical protein
MRTFFVAFLVVMALQASARSVTYLSPSVMAVSDTAKTVRSSSPYPAIPSTINRLFYLQRNPNPNTVIYELNAPGGKLDLDEPVHPYWIRYNEQGQKADLNYIQRKFAFGVSAKSIGTGKWDIRLAAYKKFPLTLMRGSDGKYHIFATISQKQAIISRIFVKIEGGTFWFPNVRFIEILATDTQTGTAVIERFKP